MQRPLDKTPEEEHSDFPTTKRDPGGVAHALLNEPNIEPRAAKVFKEMGV